MTENSDFRFSGLNKTRGAIVVHNFYEAPTLELQFTNLRLKHYYVDAFTHILIVVDTI